MRLPCFIAFTGTPLFKKDKQTAAVFGGEIDRYTVDQAVADKAVVPLLYEGRHAHQQVNEKPLDTYFNLISEPLTDYQKRDLKHKFSQANQLNEAEQKIFAICWDIARHFKDNFQGKTPFKGQLVTPSKAAALKYKRFLDDTRLVSSEVVISPPDEREGEESAYGDTTDALKAFWKQRMDEHGSPARYEENVINRFKHQQHPEILIVVDKLLTGFDEPKNTVLYLTRPLQGHTLLQAIARVNRVWPDKDFGYIIDYYGVLGALDEALQTYSSMQSFDAADLEGALTGISEEIRKLPQKHSELWDLFKTIRNRRDAEAYQRYLRDEAIRVVFYDALAAYARVLKLALSSLDFYRHTDEKQIAVYKSDLAFFLHLRSAVMQRYSDVVDYRQYEGQIQKLIDTHIQSDEVISLTKLVNIFDREEFQEEVARITGDAAKADTMASRTARHMSDRMEEDPAFYKKFSELLKEAIKAWEERRLTDAQYLERVQEISGRVLSRRDEDVPASLAEQDVARAFYGVIRDELLHHFPEADKEPLRKIAAGAALAADAIIRSLLKVDWHTPGNLDIQKRMTLLLTDYLIDEVRGKQALDLSYDDIDGLAGQILNIARKRYPQ